MTGYQKRAREEDNSPKEKKSLKKEIPHEEVECIPFSEQHQDKTFRVDMLGVDPAVVLHRLHVDPLFPPIKQRKRTFSEEKNVAIIEEVANLMNTFAI
ncbi:hypothetical protein LIER_14457 [Lithospermum erythrorhizon]|uniref:Uncharacterized protein n=1 Tax=Lithospermum erythrorhizon TaxID=34254 RepID=A0AAV3Q0U9_LITER